MRIYQLHSAPLKTCKQPSAARKPTSAHPATVRATAQLPSSTIKIQIIITITIILGIIIKGRMKRGKHTMDPHTLFRTISIQSSQLVLVLVGVGVGGGVGVVAVMLEWEKKGTQLTVTHLPL